MRHVIALDVGGTGMKAALIGADGTLLHEARRPTGRDRGPEAVVESILGFAADLRAHGIAHLGEPAAAAGVAVPGIVDAALGTAVYAANLGWRDVPLRDLLSARLAGVPVALGHDVRTGGLAEGASARGKGADRFLFVPLGTGIAGAIGIDGAIEPGAHGSAGESRPHRRTPRRPALRLRPARLPGTPRLRLRGERGVGRGERRPRGGRRGLRQGRGVR